MTPDQHWLIKQDLIRNFSLNEIADMYIEKMTDDEVTKQLAILES